MSTKQDWRERWEEKDRHGDTVTDVWEKDGKAIAYEFVTSIGNRKGVGSVSLLIPSKPAPVVVPWEPDEVPVGGVVRWISNSEVTDVIVRRFNDKFKINESWYSCEELKDHFVLHQPGVPTEQCQPCGKVVKS